MDFMHLLIEGCWCSTELCTNDIKMYIVCETNSHVSFVHIKYS